jgi:hypothetical protein
MSVAIAAYVVVSYARQTILPDPQSELGRTLDITLLYVIILLPGVVVGWMLRRAVLEWGFLCGLLADTVRSLFTAWIQLSDIPEGVEVEGFGLSEFSGIVLHAVPSAVIAAAGAAVGYVFAIRWRR